MGRKSNAQLEQELLLSNDELTQYIQNNSKLNEVQLSELSLTLYKLAKLLLE